MLALAAALLGGGTIVTAGVRPGAVDPGFAPTVIEPGAVNAMVVQPDGRIIVGGLFHWVDGTPRTFLARLHSDLTLDTTFDAGNCTGWRVFALALQPDGKVLVGGDFYEIDGTTRYDLARLNADGSLDSGFASPTRVQGSSVTALAVQTDGKVLLAGDFYAVDGIPRYSLARLDADGTLDTAFDPAANGHFYALTVQPDGKLLVGGYFTQISGASRNGIARLNRDGTLDATFVPDPGTPPWLERVTFTLQPNGKILLAGEIFATAGSSPYVARLNADGSLDGTFSPITGSGGGVEHVALQPDGKVVFGGWFTSIQGIARHGIARVNANGTLDLSFDPGAGVGSFMFRHDGVYTLIVQPDGKVLLGGSFSSIDGTMRNGIAQLNPDGTLDPDYSPGLGVTSPVFALALQPDGSVLLGGAFSSVNGVARNRVARLRADGTLDLAFNPGTEILPVASYDSGVNVVNAILLLPDGKILLGGQFSFVVDGVRHQSLMRLNADGTLDSTFEPDIGYSIVAALALQPDGKVLVGGTVAFQSNGTSFYGFVRLDSHGSLDPAFVPGAGTGDSYGKVLALAVQPDGKVLLGGFFQSINGTPRNNLARLNGDGSLDTAFDPSVGYSSVRGLALQPDGKILLGGSFSSVNGVPRYFVARLDSDGALDTAFCPLCYYGEDVAALVVQPDGKIVLGGLGRDGIARLNLDGTFDASYESSIGSGDRVNALALQPDGKIILGGHFTVVDGAPRASMARLYGSDEDGHQPRRRLQRAQPGGSVSPWSCPEWSLHTYQRERGPCKEEARREQANRTRMGDAGTGRRAAWRRNDRHGRRAARSGGPGLCADGHPSRRGLRDGRPA